MTLEDFIKKNLGNQVEVAGSADAKFQCVDLANAYIRDVLNLPIIEWTDAKDFPSKAGGNYEFIKNTPDGAPQKGDIVIWSGLVGGGHGHIAICTVGASDKFTSFDQNWSKPLFCTMENHTFINNKGQVIIDGWLRPKFIPSGNTITIPTSERDWLINRASTAKEVASYMEITDPDHAPTDAYTRVIAGYKSRITDIQTQLSGATQEAINQTTIVSNLKGQLTEKDKQIDSLQKTNSSLTGEYEGKIREKQGTIDQLILDRNEALKQLAICQGKPTGNLPKDYLGDLLKRIKDFLLKIWKRIGKNN